MGCKISKFIFSGKATIHGINNIQKCLFLKETYNILLTDTASENDKQINEIIDNTEQC